MIEILEAKSGERVVKLDGRLLASRIDPRAEAQTWLKSRMAFVNKVKTIFVLGLGSGHHIQEIRSHTDARIVVIEKSQELIETVQPWLLGCVDVVIEHIRESRDLRFCNSVRDAIKQSFIVLKHPPSLAVAQSFYDGCFTQLLGRDWGHLTWQWNLKDLPALESQPRVEPKGELLTIYDLAQTELVTNSSERERLLLKALRELVK